LLYLIYGLAFVEFLDNFFDNIFTILSVINVLEDAFNVFSKALKFNSKSEETIKNLRELENMLNN
jgi:hypothetical protein